MPVGTDPAAVTPVAGQPAAAERPLLVASHVSRHFEGVRAVEDVSMDVLPGRITGLIGPNGAGKSTFLAVLAGTLPASSGTITFDGDDVTALPAFKRARRGLVRTFQLPSEFGQLTVLENLLSAAPNNRGDSLGGALLGKRYWKADEDRLVEQARILLDRFRMSAKESDYASSLSGGQKRLVEIMRALMAEPTVLLLDEPFAGLLPTLARTIEGHLMALRDEGLTMLMVEHELGPVERMADSTIVMAQGQVLARGLMTELRDNSAVVEAYLVG